MNTYQFVGTVYYRDEAGGLRPLETTIRIDAPTKKIANGVLSNYGIGAANMRTIKLVR